MPENKDDPLCPVKSYYTYLEHLEPQTLTCGKHPYQIKNLIHKSGTQNATWEEIPFQNSCPASVKYVAYQGSSPSTLSESLVPLFSAEKATQQNKS